MSMCASLDKVIDRFTAFNLTDVRILVDGLAQKQTYFLSRTIFISNVRCLKLEPLPTTSTHSSRPKFVSNILEPVFAFSHSPCLEINNIDFNGLLMVSFSELSEPDGKIVISNSIWENVNGGPFSNFSFINGQSGEVGKPNISLSLTDVELKSHFKRPIPLIQQNDLRDKTTWNINLTRTKFTGLGFRLKFNKGSVTAINCSLLGSILDYYTVKLQNFDELVISGLQLDNELVSPTGTYGILKIDNIKTVSLAKTTFDKIKTQSIYASHIDDFSISTCRFYQFSKCGSGSLVFIDIRNKLTITGSEFQNISSSSKNSSLLLLQKITANVSIIESTFKNVTSPTFYCSDCGQLDFVDVNFTKSYRPIVVLKFTSLTVDTCHFIANKAKVGAGINIVGPGQVSIRHSNFNENVADQAGAINSQDADVYITNSTFIENTGSISGTFRFTGTLKDSKNIITLSNVFIQSPGIEKPSAKLPIFSTVMESNGPTLNTTNVTINILKTEGNIDLFITHIDPTSSLTFKCPVNTKVKSEENVFWSCSPCEKGTYSTQSGKMVKNGSSTGRTPPFKCKHCPYGGECTGQAQLSSRINFWGYHDDDGEIKFIQCLPGHCCQDSNESKPCSGINSCANNWTGVVCSKCPPNHRVSFFEDKCIPDETCKYKTLFWVFFWLFALAIFIVLAFYQDMGKKISDISRCCKRQQEPPILPPENEEEQNTNEINNITKLFYFIKIMANFYQIEILISIDSPRSHRKRVISWTKKILSSFFNLELSLLSFSESYCPVHGVDETLKLFIKKVLIILAASVLALLIFYGYYFGHCILKWLYRREIHVHPYYQPEPGYQPIPEGDGNETGDEDDELTFDIRYKIFLVRIILLGYTNIASFIMIMENCLTVGDKSILLLGGGECNSTATNVCRVLFLVWVAPFPFNVRMVSGWLQDRAITINKFMVCFIFPPFSLAYYLYKKCKNNGEMEIVEPKAKHLLSIFEASFRESKKTKSVDGEEDTPNKILLWDYCVLGRRLLVAFLCVILRNYIPRLMCVMVVLMVMTVHHMLKKPYKAPLLNWLETASFLSLTVLAGINFVWAFFYVYSLDEQPPIDILVEFLKIFEFVVSVLPVVLFVVYLIRLLWKSKK